MIRPQPRPLLPDTSAGYVKGEPLRFCTSAMTLAMETFPCLLAMGHSGSHRNRGVHWQSSEEAPTVEEA